MAHRGNSRGFTAGRVVTRLDSSVNFKGDFGSVIFAGGRFVTHVGARSLLKILLVGRAASEANRSLSSITPRPMTPKPLIIGAWERGERPQSRFLGELASYLGFEGGQELVSLIESQAGMPVTLEALSADTDRAPTTDGDTMRLLAWSFVQDRQAGSLPPEQADIYREFIEYFRVRAIDI